jgi:transposase InsO family protein
VDDQQLLAHIQADLAASPFVGEGHRKVWARLRVQRSVRVSRKRVLRVMRENQLLSPHRVPRGEPSLHDGRITTDAPNVMWGTDGARVVTVEDGAVWIFVAVEHWSTECVGFHVCKEGNRYAALEPLAMALQRIFGSVRADVARGLAVRHDHGSQYLSDHFQHQLRFWGIAPSYAFVGEPQTNGVVERFIRTLKEQVIHGRIHRNLDELRQVVAVFVEQYNEHWLVEKLGFISPTQARQAAELPLAA